MPGVVLQQVQLALSTGERRDRALGFKPKSALLYVGMAKEALPQSQLAMLRKEALALPLGCNISSSPGNIGSCGRHTQGLESVQDAFKQPQESRWKLLETLETVPGVLQQPCNWHFVQESAGIEPHWLACSWANQRALCFT